MWRTADGHLIQLPHARLRSLASQADRCGLLPLVRISRPAELPGAIRRSVGLLARNARRVGQLRHRSTGWRFPVFRSGNFDLITQPAGAGANNVLLIRRAAESELPEAFVARAGTASVNFGRAYSFRDALRVIPQQAGVYILEEWTKDPKTGRGQWKPVYIGMSKDFQSRMYKQRRRFGSHLRVRPGQIVGGNEQMRRMTEHALVRLLGGERPHAATPRTSKTYSLLTKTPRRPYLVEPGKQVRVSVTNPPPYLRPFLERVGPLSRRAYQLLRGPGLYEFSVPLTAR